MRMLLWGAILLSVATPTVAATGQVNWPTFFRAGPGQDWKVLDELQRGVFLDVQSCDGQWCVVRYGNAVGYVERAALRNGTMIEQPARPSSDCFESKRSGYAGGELFRYCLDQPR